MLIIPGETISEWPSDAFLPIMCIYGIYQQPGQTDTTEFGFF